MFDFLLTFTTPSCNINYINKYRVHIIAEIWSASFYQAAVNGLTMSESVPRATACPSGTGLIEKSNYTEGIKAQAGRFHSV